MKTKYTMAVNKEIEDVFVGETDAVHDSINRLIPDHQKGFSYFPYRTQSEIRKDISGLYDKGMAINFSSKMKSLKHFLTYR